MRPHRGKASEPRYTCLVVAPCLSDASRRRVIGKSLVIAIPRTDTSRSRLLSAACFGPTTNQPSHRTPCHPLGHAHPRRCRHSIPVATTHLHVADTIQTFPTQPRRSRHTSSSRPRHSASVPSHHPRSHHHSDMTRLTPDSDPQRYRRHRDSRFFSCPSAVSTARLSASATHAAFPPHTSPSPSLQHHASEPPLRDRLRRSRDRDRRRDSHSVDSVDNPMMPIPPSRSYPLHPFRLHSTSIETAPSQRDRHIFCRPRSLHQPRDRSTSIETDTSPPFPTPPPSATKTFSCAPDP